jgi:hypothetical protein
LTIYTKPVDLANLRVDLFANAVAVPAIIQYNTAVICLSLKDEIQISRESAARKEDV